MQRVRYPLAAAAVLLVTTAAVASAQVVVAAQPLDFGELVAGVTEVVTPADIIRRADVTLQGTTNGNVSLSLVLPATLTSSNGTSIPLQFLAGDAVFRGFNGQQQALNLLGSTTVRLHRSQTSNVYVGGRAMPSTGQRAGVYSGTVVVIIAPSGT